MESTLEFWRAQWKPYLRWLVLASVVGICLDAATAGLDRRMSPVQAVLFSVLVHLLIFVTMCGFYWLVVPIEKIGGVLVGVEGVDKWRQVQRVVLPVMASWLPIGYSVGHLLDNLGSGK